MTTSELFKELRNHYGRPLHETITILTQFAEEHSEEDIHIRLGSDTNYFYCGPLKSLADALPRLESMAVKIKDKRLQNTEQAYLTAMKRVASFINSRLDEKNVETDVLEDSSFFCKAAFIASNNCYKAKKWHEKYIQITDRSVVSSKRATWNEGGEKWLVICIKIEGPEMGSMWDESEATPYNVEHCMR